MPPRCEKCGFLHYRTDPCRQKRIAIIAHGGPSVTAAITKILVEDAGREEVAVSPPPKPKRSGNRHRPGYFTEYMRGYRARNKPN